VYTRNYLSQNSGAKVGGDSLVLVRNSMLVGLKKNRISLGGELVRIGAIAVAVPAAARMGEALPTGQPSSPPTAARGAQLETLDHGSSRLPGLPRRTGGGACLSP